MSGSLCSVLEIAPLILRRRTKQQSYHNGDFPVPALVRVHSLMHDGSPCWDTLNVWPWLRETLVQFARRSEERSIVN